MSATCDVGHVDEALDILLDEISSVEESQRGVHVPPEHRLHSYFKRKTDIHLQMNVQMEHSGFQHALYVFT